ncbi:unnamed protein product [Protopolystoma xenopodis]|uniref:Uncharacterized protein n=1 Tax=Protopolystoma xenopodis TaxID=117903 RepID=A0A3S5B565_9PLAT|nr:unnamed protein product [Protopolystoma xenopodis]
MRPVLSFFIIPEVYSRYVDVSTDYFKKCCSKIFKKLTKGDFVAKRRFVKVEEESGDSYTLDLVGESNPPTGYILLAQLDEEDGSKDISSLKCFYLTIKKNTSDSSFALSDASSIGKFHYI